VGHDCDATDRPAFGLQTWMRNADCRGANATAFFPSDGLGVEAVQRVCAACPVRVECLEYALANRLDYGVWGGASERQRQRMLRERRTPSIAHTSDFTRVSPAAHMTRSPATNNTIGDGA
jgi:WhiB family redox-sensing transcriptional regulator